MAGEHELPRDVLQAMHHPVRRHGTLGLDETQLRERLNQLQELRILPGHRVQSRARSGVTVTAGLSALRSFRIVIRGWSVVTGPRGQ